jgi:uncharacterized protein YdcH (DUF465 family)
MQTIRSWTKWMVAALLLAVVFPVPAGGYYGHRNYRGYHRGRGNSYSRMANAQRASAAMNAANARVQAARANLARQMSIARKRAENSPALKSAKSNYAQVNGDNRTARDAVIAKLKAENQDFRNLLDECQTLRQQIAALAKSGSSPDQLTSLQSKLNTKARKVVLMEDEAVSADSSVKDGTSRQASAHQELTSAEKAVAAAVAQDPNVKAAQNQLAQATAQANAAAARYNSSLMSASYGGGRSYYRRGGYSHRGYGYGYGGGVRVYVSSNRSSGHHVSHGHARVVHYRSSNRRRHR